MTPPLPKGWRIRDVSDRLFVATDSAPGSSGCGESYVEVHSEGDLFIGTNEYESGELVIYRSELRAVLAHIDHLARERWGEGWGR